MFTSKHSRLDLLILLGPDGTLSSLHWIKTLMNLISSDELGATETNTQHLVVGGALGARQMHSTPQHGRKSVCHSVSFQYTISFLVSHALFGSA